MSTRLIPGQRTWRMSRDSEGHRTYKITYRVVSDSPLDGPATVIQTPGLPLVGSFWVVDNDVDLFAWCRADAEVEPVLENEPNKYWDVTFTFSTKSITDREGGGGFGGGNGNGSGVEDPLLQPQKISGNFIKYTEIATQNAAGMPITNSAHEKLEGAAVEFDANRPAIRIEQNVLLLGAEIFTSMVDTVNASPLWGLPARTIKLSNVTWEKKYYGPGIPYYTRILDFEINRKTFDRFIEDIGRKVLKGHWSRTTGLWVLDKIGGRDPDPSNPSHFITAVDIYGNPTPIRLDGAGKPYAPPTAGSVDIDLLNATGFDTEAVPTSALLLSKTDLMPTANIGSTYQSTTIGGPLLFTAPVTKWAAKFTGMAAGRIVINGDQREAEAISAYPINTNGKIPRRSVTRNGSFVVVEWHFDAADAGDAIYDTEPTETMFVVLHGGFNAAGFLQLGRNVEFHFRVEGVLPSSSPGVIVVSKYPSSDFLLLGIPTTF